jgi:hypothetical protein
MPLHLPADRQAAARPPFPCLHNNTPAALEVSCSTRCPKTWRFLAVSKALKQNLLTARLLPGHPFLGSTTTRQKLYRSLAKSNTLEPQTLPADRQAAARPPVPWCHHNSSVRRVLKPRRPRTARMLPDRPLVPPQQQRKKVHANPTP